MEHKIPVHLIPPARSVPPPPPPPPSGDHMTVDQEIRARAAAAAYPPFGNQTRAEVISMIEEYIRTGGLP